MYFSPLQVHDGVLSSKLSEANKILKMTQTMLRFFIPVSLKIRQTSTSTYLNL